MHVYGLSTEVLEFLPLERALEEIVQAGFSAVELRANHGTFGSWGVGPAEMCRALERFDLLPWSVHSPAAGWDLAADTDPARLAAVGETAASFRPARDLGAELVVCHCNAPGKPFAAADYSASLSRTRGSLETLAAEADRVGIRLAVETMIFRPEKRPCTRVAEILRLIDGLGEHVGVCLDTGHSNASGADVAEEVVAAGEKLFNVHIQDNHGRANEDEHLLPGLGTIDWRVFLDALDRAGFARPRIVEVNRLNGPDSLGPSMRQLGDTLRRWQA